MAKFQCILPSTPQISNSSNKPILRKISAGPRIVPESRSAQERERQGTSARTRMYFTTKTHSCRSEKRPRQKNLLKATLHHSLTSQHTQWTFAVDIAPHAEASATQMLIHTNFLIEHYNRTRKSKNGRSQGVRVASATRSQRKMFPILCRENCVNMSNMSRTHYRREMAVVHSSKLSNRAKCTPNDDATHLICHDQGATA